MSYFSVKCYPTWLIDARENVGGKLFSADKENYIVVKSSDRISFMNKQGEMDSKDYPLYIHFKAESLKEYAQRIHEAFPLGNYVWKIHTCQITRGRKSFP